jgi:hypothetical protein
MIKRLFIVLILIHSCLILFSQGFNHTWLLGYGNWTNKGRINFNNTNYQLLSEQRQMRFLCTQGNISDNNGNFLMSSNGLWIANANNNLMLNGDSLNPNSFTSDYFPDGLPLPNGNLILPWPDDTTKYILFHQTGNYDPNYNLVSRELYYSVIDILGDNGNGEVILKNQIIIQDSLGWGLGACKHANGRDWWIVALKDSMDMVYKILLTPNGIDTIMIQDFPNMQPYSLFAGQPTFSPDGKKFAFAGLFSDSGGNWHHNLRIFSFDRCNGVFYNSQLIDLTNNVSYGWGIAFSPSSKFLYASKLDEVYQFNSDTSDISSSMQIIAVYDGFMSGIPPTCCSTSFYLMYLAANGKIYITSNNGVQHIHEMNYPDSAGISCDLQQHSINLGVWHFASVPNHPNYYLECDTTLGCTPCYIIPNVNENCGHDFKFNVYPNPSSGNFNIIYLLPQNKEGKLEVFDITGKVVYEMRLPQWSTLQQMSLPHLSKGIYAVKINS